MTERIFRSGKKEVRLSSADRVLWPDDGITKGELWDYYEAVASTLVAHLKDRPFTMKRYREGVAGQVFFQKQAPKGMPDWIPTKTFRTFPRGGRRREEMPIGGTRKRVPTRESRLVDFPLVNDTAALLWMVQMHCIDMNAWYSRWQNPEKPDYIVFDLDPPEADDAFVQCIRVAHLLREFLATLDLRAYVKTSGSDGIHLLVPIQRRIEFPQAYDFAEAVSRRLEAEHDGLVTTEWLKKKRRGVLVDHRQNGHGKTIASVYSVRPRAGAPVSTPLEWDELTEDVRPRDFSFSVVLDRVERLGDLYAPVLEDRQALGPALKELGVSSRGRS